MSAPITEAVDISPDAVEEMAEWCENGGRRRTVRPSQMLRALSSALTASEKQRDAAIALLRDGLPDMLWMSGAEGSPRRERIKRVQDLLGEMK